MSYTYASILLRFCFGFASIVIHMCTVDGPTCSVTFGGLLCAIVPVYDACGSMHCIVYSSYVHSNIYLLCLIF